MTDLWQHVLLGIVQLLVISAAAPFFSGLMRVVTAKIHSRQGPPILQDYRDLAKLFTRQDVYPQESGLIFRLAPVVMLASYLALALGIPMIARMSPVPFFADIITLIYLMALPRFFFSLTSIDSGSPLASLGGIRELIIGTLVEPAMMLGLVVLAMLCGTTALDQMGLIVTSGSITSPIALILCICAFGFACYVELGKLPFDLAEAEQELQEGPLTEYSGPSLALVKASMTVKQMVVLGWFIALFIPWGAAADFSLPALALGLVVYLVKLFVLYLAVGLVANTVVRVRYKFFGRYSWIAVGIAVLAFVFYVVGI